ncbi:hypothetical protein WMY93_010515 [Mugilogobius chulae]|uniref:Uncharacterized protein n=1 Tax=Mugilogobius chulae TaxID=88201 RepID=A0AAW0PD95_9GOBI
MAASFTSAPLEQPGSTAGLTQRHTLLHRPLLQTDGSVPSESTVQTRDSVQVRSETQSAQTSALP